MQIRHRRTLRQPHMPLSRHGCQATASSSGESLIRPSFSSIVRSCSTRRQLSIGCAAKKRRVAQSPVEAPPEEDVIAQVRFVHASISNSICPH